jgi:hypothetical protein
LQQQRLQGAHEQHSFSGHLHALQQARFQQTHAQQQQLHQPGMLQHLMQPKMVPATISAPATIEIVMANGPLLSQKSVKILNGFLSPSSLLRSSIVCAIAQP